MSEYQSDTKLTRVKTNREISIDKLTHWRVHPEGAIDFVRDQFGAEPDPDQRDALIAYQTGKPRTCLKASKGTGKTTVLAWVAWHFLVVWEDANVAATSITSDNLRDGLWKEMAVWQNKSKFLLASFQWQKERIFYKCDPNRIGTWWMAARGWSKSANTEEQANTLAGLHAKRILFILDETGGMPRAIMATAEAALSSGEVCKIVQAGNPTNLEGPLYDATTVERPMWNVIEMTGDPDNPKRSPRVSIQWARDQIKKYGRNSPWVKVNVFGEFPEASLNTLLGPNEVTEAMQRHLKWEQYEWAQKRLGIDVARFGDDLTVIFPRQGKASFTPVAMSHPRNSPASVDIAARVTMAKQKWGSEMEFFDDTVGWAHGAVDIMRANKYPVMAIRFEGEAINPRYYNKRAEIWMEMADWVKGGGALPNVPELMGELTIPQYSYMSGKFIIEPKDDIKERLGRSPNYADALALTFSMPDMPNEMAERLRKMRNNQHASTEFDPYAAPHTQRAETEYDPYADNRI
jgi:phage terminase large subunit